MPSKNAIKEYVPGGIQHIYNRGVEKRDVFIDQSDYEMFKFCVRRAAARCSDFDSDIALLSQCLMPNHFHLVVRQRTARGIEGFMRSLMNTYVKYFNEKYDRVGSLFQGPYKAVLVRSDAQLIQVLKYLRQNPVEAGLVTVPDDYVHLRESPWAGVSL